MDNDISALRAEFNNYDLEKTGSLSLESLTQVLHSLELPTNVILDEAKNISKNNEVTFEDFVHLLQLNPTKRVDPEETTTQMADEHAQTLVINHDHDLKVLEFLNILEDYRIKCEAEGNYLEAGRAYKQLGILRKQEEKRQRKTVLIQQESERNEMQSTHKKQFEEFTLAWDRYLDEYDRMAQIHIQQMTERHEVSLSELQVKLREDIVTKPPRWSKELIDQRRRQHICAQNRNYKDAIELKKICDEMEEKEIASIEQDHIVVFARREAKFRLQQHTELQALLKRVECRRKEHMKQRATDSKRLLQRNKNCYSALESRQNLEVQRLFDNIHKSLFLGSHGKSPIGTGSGHSNIGTPATTSNVVSSRVSRRDGSEKPSGLKGSSAAQDRASSSCSSYPSPATAQSHATSKYSKQEGIGSTCLSETSLMTPDEVLGNSSVSRDRLGLYVDDNSTMLPSFLSSIGPSLTTVGSGLINTQSTSEF